MEKKKRAQKPIEDMTWRDIMFEQYSNVRSGRQIAAARCLLGLSISELADASGLEVHELEGIERSKRFERTTATYPCGRRRVPSLLVMTAIARLVDMGAWFSPKIGGQTMVSVWPPR